MKRMMKADILRGRRSAYSHVFYGDERRRGLLEVGARSAGLQAEDRKQDHPVEVEDVCDAQGEA